jgi:beta-lactamase class A
MSCLGNCFIMSRILFSLLLLTHVTLMAATQTHDSLQSIVDRAVAQTHKQFQKPELKQDQLAVTVVQLDSKSLVQASVNGDARFYPASVVKLFYLAATHRWLEDKKLEDTSELRRAMHDMIVDSSNDATGYIVDLLSGTTGGPELPPAELEVWSKKRDVVTQYYQSLGYSNVNANRKPWGDGPFGRESQAQKVHAPQNNYLSTNDTAQLFSDIAMLRCISEERSKQMLVLLDREVYRKNHITNFQATAFSAAGLPVGTKLWSKAGWTSSVRHDAILIELPNKEKYIIVTFTAGKEHANNREIIPAVVKRIVSELNR